MSSNSRIFAMVVVCVATLSTELGAATYYVRTDGHDTNCNGQTDAPSTSWPNCAFATPAACATAFVTGQGDDCLIRAGTYTSCPTITSNFHGGARTAFFYLHNKSGVSGNRSVVRGFGDGQVIFAAPTGCDYGVLLDASDYIDIGGTAANEGITFRGDFDHNDCPGSVPADQGTVSLVGHSNNPPSQTAGSNNVRILGNTLEGTRSLGCFAQTDGEIFLADGSRTGNEIAHNSITWRVVRAAVAGNEAQGDCCSDPGTVGQCQDENMLIHHNTMIWDPDSPSGTYRAHALSFRGGAQVSIYDNWIQYLASTGSQTRELILIRDGRNWNVYNNYIETLASNTVPGSVFIYFQNGCQPTSTNDVEPENHRIYSNTFVGGAAGAIRLQDTEGTEIRNNIIYGLSAGSIGSGFLENNLQGDSTGSYGYTVFHNVTSPWGSGNPDCANLLGAANCDADSTNVYANPLLLLSGAKPVPHFRLNATSPAINRGSTDSDVPGVDYDGQPRGTAPDIGADEYTTGGGPVCGNGVREGSEVCDGADLGGQTCQSQGFPAGGALGCHANCSGFDTSQCSNSTDITPPAPVGNLRLSAVMRCFPLWS